MQMMGSTARGVVQVVFNIAAGVGVGEAVLAIVPFQVVAVEVEVEVARMQLVLVLQVGVDLTTIGVVLDTDRLVAPPTRNEHIRGLAKQ
jgi:hypothetical protein